MSTIIQRKEPWLTEEANKILAEIVSKGKNLSVFEYGSGASTIWFSKQKNIDQIVSVEHDMDWYIKTCQHIRSTHIYLIKQMPYNNTINSFGLFDIILIDGRNRVKCIESAIPHLKPNGVLILDNSEREYYNHGIELLKDFNRTDTFQSKPDKYGFTYPGWQTTFFYKK